MAQAERDGDQWFGSLAFGYDHRSDALTLIGYGRVDGSRKTLDAYSEQGAGIYDVAYHAQRVRNTAVALGLEGTLQVPESRLRPFWSVEYRQTPHEKDDADLNLNYVQWGAPQDYRVRMQSYNDNALSLAAGLDIQVSRSWMPLLLFGHEKARGADSSRTRWECAFPRARPAPAQRAQRHRRPAPTQPPVPPACANASHAGARRRATE